mmetsp:Transcript_13262/g.33380  ORF Transcript_13262/g.33380 Transcript_13262/m.33380 type:complete len:646 (+) Transcript_13262:205-2142(+)
MLFYDLLVLFVLFLPRLIQGFALIHHRPSDPFKVQRSLQRDGFYNSLRPGSPPMSVSGSEQFAFSFSFSNGISSSKEKNGDSETQNRTLLANDNNNKTEPEMIGGNFTNSTNTTSANKTAIDSKSKATRSSGFTYFNFPSFQPQPTTRKESPKVTAVNKSVNKESKENKDKSNIYFYNTKKKPGENKLEKNKIINNNSTAMSLLNKDANETITVADLEVLLSRMQATSNSDGTKDSKKKALVKGSTTAGVKKGYSQTATGSSVSSQVAFPQQSEVSETDIRRSTAITSSFVGMIIGITILPNLWLVGMVAGVLYGYEITKDIAEYDPGEKNGLANFLISTATRLAKVYRKAVDGLKALWFLYKTGQLSYEYYKTYETMDKKFAIQQKVDAWNRVFVKGKVKFDTWEKENEVGRKVLAGIRTAWLVDEESRKRAAGKSRYRLVQYFYDLRRSARKLIKRAIKSVRSLLEEGGLETFWKGLQTDLQSEGSLSIRIGAIAAAVAAVNVFGALFSISAGFSNLIAIVVAVIWPSWTSDLFSRAQEIWLDIQSRGSSGDRKVKGPFNPFECMQQLYEDHSSSRVKESQRSQRRFRKRPPKRRKNTLASTKRKTRKPYSTQKKQSWFGFGNRQKGRSGSDVGTWGNFRRTR